MNMYRKFSQRSKSLVCAALFTICLISCSMLPVSAADIETDAFFQGQVWAQRWNGTAWERFAEVTMPSDYENKIQLPRQGEFDEPVGQWFSRSITFAGVTAGISSLIVEKPEDSTGFYGNCALYFNWYMKLYDIPAGQYRTFDTPLFFYVYDASGKMVDSGQVDYTFYDVDPSVVSGNVTKGVACSIKFNVPEAIPAVRVVFRGEDLGKVGWFANNKNWEYHVDSPIEFYIPSATLLASVKSAEVEALEDVTNAIIEQNGLTQEKFTEVIGKVDEVYKELGTTNGLLEESMQQFEDWDTVTSVPGNVQDKTDKADQVISDINSLVKPDPEDIVPDMDADTSFFADIIAPYFDNFLLAQMCVLVFSFAFVSYVLFGKKG